jgi:hypothetical protein
MGRRSTHIVIHPSFVITHRMGLDDAPQNYETFKQKEDDCMKAVLTPGGGPAADLRTRPCTGRTGRLRCCAG